MTYRIGEITVNLRANDIAKISFSQTSLKFRCQRCAVFCCKCGGPRLSPKDVRDLKRSGKSLALSIDTKDMTMKERKDGSCILLTVDSDKAYKCSVYNVRPILCRTYPFQFERLGEDSFALNLIPCCNGLNAHDGDPIDERFFKKHLRKPFLDLLDHGQHCPSISTTILKSRQPHLIPEGRNIDAFRFFQS